MKRQHPIRTMTGLTQEDIAMLLGISRGRWSMFEIGRRDLPLSASQLLGEMLTFLKDSKPVNKSDATQRRAEQKQLERLLLKNEYQQMTVAREIAAATIKQEAQGKRVQLMGFLASKRSDKGTGLRLVSKSSKFDEPLSVLLVELGHRLELLGIEKRLLEGKLGK